MREIKLFILFKNYYTFKRNVSIKLILIHEKLSHTLNQYI
jgi:hypothetical protein